jgi:hypothetical protein
MPGASSWSFQEEDFKAISAHMSGLLRESNVQKSRSRRYNNTYVKYSLYHAICS